MSHNSAHAADAAASVVIVGSDETSVPCPIYAASPRGSASPAAEVDITRLLTTAGGLQPRRLNMWYTAPSGPSGTGTLFALALLSYA